MSVPSPDFLTCPAVPELLPPKEEVVVMVPQKPKRRMWPWIVLAFALIVAVLVAPLIYGGVIASRAATKLQSDMQAAQQAAQAYDFSTAESRVADAKTDLKNLQNGLNAVGPWKNAPVIRPYMIALSDAARAGEATLAGVSELVGVGKTIEEAFQATGAFGAGLNLGLSPAQTFASLLPSEKRAILARVSQTVPQMRLAREKMQAALLAWQRIPQDGLSATVRDQMQAAITKFGVMQRQMDEGITFAEVLMPMTGYPAPKNYLILLQNAEEMRGTGGFIGTVGFVHTDAAELTDLQFQDVYSIDNPVASVWKDEPPEPLKKYLELKAWFLRDSNWSPDFPQTAERIMDVYNRERNLAHATTTKLDGVIAFEPGFFRDVLRITGPIKIDDQTFTADNFFDELEYQVEIGFQSSGIPRPQRKDIVARVGDAMMKSLKDIPASRWPQLLDVFTAALARKDVLIYDREPSTLALLDQQKWSGRTQWSSEDFLWVVDTNTGAMKTDGVMKKSITYARNDMADRSVATVVLRYRNTNPHADWRYTRYRDYVRVYVPDGSVLLTSEGAMENDKARLGGKFVAGKVETSHDLGKTVFSAFWAVEPGETRELRFTYRLPAGLAQPNRTDYHLYVQKQPGSVADLTLNLSFGKNIKSAAPPEGQKEWGDARYRANMSLETDRSVDIHF